MKIICNQIYAVHQKPVIFGKTSTIAGQDYKLEDLLARFSRGQRLGDMVNVHDPELYDAQHPDETMETEDMPQFDDIVELREYEEAHKERKSAFKERLATKKREKETQEQQAKEQAEEKNH